MVTAVFKAFKILGLFTSERPIWTLTEITNELEFPKSTIHSILGTLESMGFIEKKSSNSYALGKAIIPMTQGVLVNVELRDRAAPLLRELGDSCGESIYLTVLDGNYCLYIYAIETSHRLLARSAVGDRVPLHCTAVGKAILSFMPQDVQEAIIDEVGLPKFTEKTITEKKTLLEDLARTKQRGYAIDNEEHEGDTFCIGSPIFNEQGEVIGACSIAGHSKYIIEESDPLLLNKLRYTAQEISRRMGFVPSRDKLIWNNPQNPIYEERSG